MFNLRQLAALVLTTAVSASAFAAGYEKNIMWSGRHAGPAGTGAAWASGPEALYFNPAGVVTKAGDRAVTGNLSLVTSQFTAPVQTPNQSLESEREYYGVPAFFYASSPTDKFGYAVGLYAAGGSRVHFGNVDLTSIDTDYANFKPTLKSEIEAVELSLGGAYKISNDLKVGAAYRFGRATAAFSSGVAIAGAAASILNVDSLEGYQHGFRLGAQYQPEAKPFGVGVTYRSPLHLSLTGDASGTVVPGAGGAAGTPFPITSTSGDTTVRTVFPTQISTGAFWDVAPEAWRLHFEHVFTQYSSNQKLAVDGFVTNAVTGTTEIPDVAQQWRDQHNVRVAAEYLKTKYPVRVGYVWSSGVENPDRARAIFAAPGEAHTFTVGTGRGNEHWDYNVAAEYIFVEADAVPAASPTTGNFGTQPGTYETNAYALHLGVTYKF